MAVLNIKVYPEKILRERAKRVEKIGKDERKLAYDMIETMRFSNGVGIAAPQVGISKRIIVIEGLENNREVLVLVNPKIVKKRGRSSFCEGCLSVPGLTNDIIRAKSVVVEALNLDGEALKIDEGGLLARVLQHEIDHLDGILFIDRVGFLKRKRIMKQISSKVCLEL